MQDLHKPISEPSLPRQSATTRHTNAISRNSDVTNLVWRKTEEELEEDAAAELVDQHNEAVTRVYAGLFMAIQAIGTFDWPLCDPIPGMDRKSAISFLRDMMPNESQESLWDAAITLVRECD